MLGMDPNGGRQGQPGAGAAGEAPGEEDPIMKMMAQMMGGGAGGPGGLPGFPPGGAFPGMPGFPGQQQQVQKPDPYTSLWRVLHAVVALGLGLYIAILTPFTGTKAERDTDALSDEENEHRKRLFFWVFATAESLLLSTRFFLDKGRTPPTGIAWTVVGYLPQPFAGYASHALRYGGMFATVRADILACMFVLGVCSWWRV
jgi:hypothetical protein